MEYFHQTLAAYIDNRYICNNVTGTILTNDQVQTVTNVPRTQCSPRDTIKTIKTRPSSTVLMLLSLK